MLLLQKILLAFRIPRAVCVTADHHLSHDMRREQRGNICCVIYGSDLYHVEANDPVGTHLPDQGQNFAAGKSAGYRRTRAWSKCGIDCVDIDADVIRNALVRNDGCEVKVEGAEFIHGDQMDTGFLDER